jgi:hypothetical protein
MSKQLEKYKREFLQIEDGVVKYNFEIGKRLKEYPGCERREEIFDEIYESKFDAYMDLVNLRSSALTCPEMSESEKTALDLLFSESIRRYKENLDLALIVSLKQKEFK